MKRYSFVVLSFWIALSLFILFFSYRLELGGFRSPGPGLMPFLIGILLLMTALFSLVRSLLRGYNGPRHLPEKERQIPFRKISLVVASLLAYSFLLERLGYLLTAILVLTLLFRNVGSNRWSFSLAISIVTALMTYLFFTYLGVIFPGGILSLEELFRSP